MSSTDSVAMIVDSLMNVSLRQCADEDGSGSCSPVTDGTHLSLGGLDWRYNGGGFLGQINQCPWADV